eukprot:CAMPEP_0201536500 /NCGR_PEP_ID=MMETSP0161_2-20130828/62028_1 /ASSEMBLY_ACC=CAM_ASM_000251 /TAXON_ID=180227 /ORGANISM="Neoparamoeba aestuarina, Strain SoJaBio B1-5/56/2" /LENGTH=177 /DNA_ID=CAMNT_0047942243 /DNA_START=368 /DNA_END=901 /DNA_ORIENTATION=+
MMIDEGVLSDKEKENNSPCAMARILFFRKFEFDGECVAEYLSEPGKFESKVLEFYLRYWDLPNTTPFDQALRKFLGLVRLPKESQKIDRVIHGFAKHYASISGDTTFKNAQDVHLLAFSTVMLNTDAHNPNVSGQRMSVSDFIENLEKAFIPPRKNNFPKPFLEDLYWKINKEEIKF